MDIIVIYIFPHMLIDHFQLIYKPVIWLSTSIIYLQVREDFQSGVISEVSKHPKDGLGLAVTDVLHYLMENPGI